MIGEFHVPAAVTQNKDPHHVRSVDPSYFFPLHYEGIGRYGELPV
jgi:hypothetical protein